jgi:hypothetical protein
MVKSNMSHVMLSWFSALALSRTPNIECFMVSFLVDFGTTILGGKSEILHVVVTLHAASKIKASQQS